MVIRDSAFGLPLIDAGSRARQHVRGLGIAVTPRHDVFVEVSATPLSSSIRDSPLVGLSWGLSRLLKQDADAETASIDAGPGDDIGMVQVGDGCH